MIRTFIFFDLETTGLFTKTSVPKITELSLVAVSRSAICDTTDSLPRVLHKLVLPMHPGIQINRNITEITGLSNANLGNVQPFDCDTYALINSFLKRLIAPICFVAYNGNTFDYPLILWEYKNINKVFDNDILSIDMLYLVKDFFSNKNDAIEELNNTQLALYDDCDEMLSEALDNFNKSWVDNPNEGETVNFGNNETPYFSNSKLDTPHTGCYEKIQKINEKTPENQKISMKSKRCEKSLEDKKRNIIKRKLNFSNNQVVNYKLPTIYEHFCGELPENAHSAEGDCLTMIRCAIKLGNFFVQWADSHAKPLISYSKV